MGIAKMDIIAMVVPLNLVRVQVNVKVNTRENAAH